MNPVLIGILAVVAYLVGIFVIGVPMAKKSYKLWMANYPKGGRAGFVGYLLFPAMSMFGELGGYSNVAMTWAMDMAKEQGGAKNVDSEEFRRLYISYSAVGWGFRVVWTIVMGFVVMPIVWVLLEALPRAVRRFAV